MIPTSDASLVKNLAELDAEVSYIFPASDDLAQSAGAPCADALTTNGATVQAIPTYGYGWDGPGLGAATVFVCTTT